VPHAIPAGADPGQAQHYDWSQAEDELRDVLPARFVGDGETADSASAASTRRTRMTRSTPA